MEILQSLEKFKSTNIAITIGNFDGLHIGHKFFLESVLNKANNLKLPLIVVTFNPHPNAILRSVTNFLINSHEEKIKLLSEIGIKYVLEIKFDRDISTLSPDVFLNRYICINKNIKLINIGHDFAFGTNKSGNAGYIEDFCKNNKIIFEQESPVKVEGETISSSKIREMIKLGDIVQANEFLGRRFCIEGRVIKGAGRGKKIGFPTANLLLSADRILPGNGVYITMSEVNNLKFQSVTNIGHNPTFTQNSHEICVETHLLDFNSDIYGERISVEFLDKIRDEKKFPDANHLVVQIKEDIKSACKMFGKI